VYHNSFSGSGEALHVSGYASNIGLPETLFINNIISAKRALYLYSGSKWNDTHPSLRGHFDYNWIRGGVREGWGGSHNIISSQKMWSTYPPEFKKTNESATERGLDLSKPFTMNKRDYAPLPGMETGYYSGSKPDLGAIQSP